MKISFDLVFKETGEQVPGFERITRICIINDVMNELGFVQDDFFPENDVKEETLKQYQVLLYLDPVDTLSNTNRNSFQHQRLISLVNNKHVGDVTFEVDGYVFYILRDFLL